MLTQSWQISICNPGKQRRIVVEWLNSTVPNLKLPTNASDEDLRACLTGGPILCRLLNKLKPGSVNEVVETRNAFALFFFLFFVTKLHS